MHDKTDRIILNSLQAVPSRAYAGIGMNDLVCDAVYRLAALGIEATAESIVAACFLLFPDRFHLRGFPNWPDSTVVNKRWLDCRSKGYLIGSTAKGFRLSPAGLSIAQRIEEALSAAGVTGSAHAAKAAVYDTETRTRAGRFVAALEDSRAYKLFSESRNVLTLGEFDIREMLLCPMESPAKTLFSNLQQLRGHAEVYERKDLTDFLDACAERLGQLLAGQASGSDSKMQKGMIRRPRR